MTVIHYTNLVCWERIYEMYQAGEDKIYVDSISLYLLAKMCNKKLVYKPATTEVFRLISNSSEMENAYFLTARRIDEIPDQRQSELPKDLKIVDSEKISSIIQDLQHGASVYIGISSPKQNSLAQRLLCKRDDIKFYCVGAALEYGFKLSKSNSTSKLSSSGLEWVKFLIVTPRRTIRKLFLTIVETVKILFSNKRRLTFKKFLNACEAQRS